MIMLVEDRVSSLEEEAAGPDMAAQAVAQIKNGRQSQISDLVDGNLDKVNGKIVGDAAKAGDELALEIVRRAGKIFGLGIINLLLLFNPSIVVIGGGVANLGDLIFDPMNEAIRKYTIDPAYWRDLKIVAPKFGEDVSIYGAAVLVLTKGGVVDVREVIKQLNK